MESAGMVLLQREIPEEVNTQVAQVWLVVLAPARALQADICGGHGHNTSGCSAYAWPCMQKTPWQLDPDAVRIGEPLLQILYSSRVLGRMGRCAHMQSRAYG